MKLEHISLNLVLSFERVHLFDFSSLYFSSSSFNFSLYLFVLFLGSGMQLRGRVFAHGAMGRGIDPSWGGPIELFSFQPVLHNWCNKGRGMCYPVCWMVHIKEPLLLIDKSSLCGGSGFPFSLSEWSLTICLTPYNRK